MHKHGARFGFLIIAAGLVILLAACAGSDVSRPELDLYYTPQPATQTSEVSRREATALADLGSSRLTQEAIQEAIRLAHTRETVVAFHVIEAQKTVQAMPLIQAGQATQPAPIEPPVQDPPLPLTPTPLPTATSPAPPANTPPLSPASTASRGLPGSYLFFGSLLTVVVIGLTFIGNTLYGVVFPGPGVPRPRSAAPKPQRSSTTPATLATQATQPIFSTAARQPDTARPLITPPPQPPEEHSGPPILIATADMPSGRLPFEQTGDPSIVVVELWQVGGWVEEAEARLMSHRGK